MAVNPSAVQYLPLSGGALTGNLNVAGNIQTTGLGNIAANGALVANAGSLDIQAAGQGLKVAEGANAKQGRSTLVAGVVTVANTSVTANSKILPAGSADGGTPGFQRVSTRTPGTSFTITSSSGTDTSNVDWEMMEPG